MGVSRFIWSTLILGTCYLVILSAQELKETISKEETEVSKIDDDNDSVILNEILTRKPNANKTVAKVEAILAKDPTLPRLTRGEIIAILENITKTGTNKTEEQNETVHKNNDDDDNNNSTRKEKSLLVVLPYNPNNDSRGGLEVLYTKEPMTRLLLEGTTTPSYKNLTNSVNPTAETSTTPSTTRRQNKRRRKPMKPIVVMPLEEKRPVYVQNLKTSTTTQPPLESSSEEQWKPYTAYDSPFVVTQKPSTVEIPLPDNMRNTLNSLNLPKNHKPEGHIMYVTLPENHPRQETTLKPTTTAPPSTTTKRPRKKSSKPKTTATLMPDISGAVESLTPEMKQMLADLGLVPGQPDGGMNTRKLEKTTTSAPIPVNFQPINPTVDISSYMSFKPLPVKSKYNDNNVMDNDMKKILSNFGLLSSNQPPSMHRLQKSLDFDEDKQEQSSDNSTDTDTVDSTTIENDKENIYNINNTKEQSTERNNTSITLADINTDVLSDEMRDMLEDLGVIKDSKRRGKGHIFNPVTQSALLDKPDQAERISKILGDIKKLSENNETYSLNPDEFRAQLDNITAIVFNDDNKEIEDDLSFSQSENEADDEEDHGVVYGANGNFDGYEPDEEELVRIQGVPGNPFVNNINNVNSFIKWNYTNNEENKDSLSVKLQEIITQPDPLSMEELHQMQEAYKNEVKRQQPESTSESDTSSSSESETTSPTEDSSETTSDPSTSEPAQSSSSSSTDSDTSSSETTTTTTTESSPNIKDLEDSFGGETPPSRPNGLYFLLDWNTFLRVGQDNRTVNLQFAPKVGDPRNFIPVTVP
ncbi:uncharacterized protein LOC142331576 [Lycorma delicatula]|uniref:uncharacterized protein LOC142331576 n=1 Tax=Lycorma delicatula TaxID=130591 RepID=UPI003F50E501